MIRRGPVFRAVSAVLLVTTTACVSWRPYEGIQADDPEQDRTIRLHLMSGETVALKNAFITGDSMWVGMRADANPPRRTTILLTDVQSVEEAHYRLAGRGGKVVVIALLAGVVAWGIIDIAKNGLDLGIMRGR